MKKVILLIALLALFVLPCYADSIKPVKIVDDNNDICIDEINNQVKVGLYDNSGDQIGVDITTSGITVASFIQTMVMEGKVLKFGVQDLALADDASLTALITTSGTVNTYIHTEASAGGDAELFLYEAPTVSTVGTSTVGQRINRQIGSTFKTTISYGATCSNYGTKISDRIIAGGTGGNAAGSDTNLCVYIPLAKSTQYLIRLENEGGGAKVAGLCCLIIED
jgi:hypothetical protein